MALELKPETPESWVIRAISDAELERRWALTRAAMEREGIQALVMRNSEDWLGGYVKWFTDVPAVNAYGSALVFHAAEPMTLVLSGPGEGRRAAGPELRGVVEIVTTAAFASVGNTGTYEGTAVGDILSQRAYRRVGFVGTDWLPHGFVRTLEARMGAGTFVDATALVDTIKALKSTEEWGLIRETAALQDHLFERALALIRPGLREIDLTAQLQFEGILSGSEQGIFQCGSAPLGQRATYRRRHFQARTMQNGDHLTLLIENNGAGGYYAELARTIVLGKASAELLEETEKARTAQAFAVAALQPGRTGREVFELYSGYLAANGLPPERRLFSHGQGYDLVERPLIRGDETMPIAADMCLAVHPGWQTDSVYINLCDNYRTSADGTPENLHQTAKKVFEIFA
jgi:Xaa-Pro aminopeptidase